MHQHQLLAFASQFGILRLSVPHLASFTSPDYPEHCFLPPARPLPSKLTPSQFKHLQQHYYTIQLVDSLQDPELVNMDPHVQIWRRCQKDKTIFHCAEYERKNSTRLNHLICIKQTVDANARFSYASRPEDMIDQYFYIYVQFYCVHTFRGKASMLMYSGYRTTEVYHGLVQDKGHKHYGFQDITVLKHLCAKVSCSGGKTFIIDTPDRMEKRLREDLQH